MGKASILSFILASSLVSTVAPASPRRQQQEGASPTDLLQSGRALLESGRYPEAIAVYQLALEKQPANEAVGIGLADAYRRVHNLDEARSVLSLAGRRHPQSPAVLKALGNLEIEAQSYDAAIAALEAAVALAPRDTEARNWLGSALEGKGDLPAAVAQFDRVLAQDPRDPLARFLRAQCYADLNENEKALADAEAVLRVRETYLPARMLLAKILVRQKQCGRAAATLRPQNPPTLDTQGLFLLANAYDCAGHPELAAAARDEFAASSQADRKQAEAETQSKHLVEQAGALAQRNQFPEAFELLHQALDKNPRNAFAYSQQAKILFSMQEFARARAAIAEALALQPYQPDFLYVKGVIAGHDGDAAGALAAFEEVTRINPKEADAFFEMGKIRRQQGDRPGALAAFRRATALDPQDAEYKRALDSLASSTP